MQRRPHKVAVAQKWVHYMWAVVAGLLYVAAMPPIGLSWAAVVAIAIMAVVLRRGLTLAAVTVVAVGVHLVLYAWLRHVSVAGWIGLGVVAGMLWIVPLWLWSRYGNLIGAAIAWVGVELLRQAIGWGWLPLAASVVGTPVANWASVGGQSLVSAMVATLGIGLAQVYVGDDTAKKMWLRVRSLVLWGGALGIIILGGMGLAVRSDEEVPVVRMGVVQPDIPMKIEPTNADYSDQLNKLRRLSNSLRGQKIDMILWPEQATPWPINSDRRMRSWMEDGAEYLGVPIVTGVLWSLDNKYYNAATVVEPERGLSREYYAKRRLVPWGEYIPLAQWGWMRSLTPIVSSFAAGEDPQILAAAGVRLWPLICYEDTLEELSWGADKADVLVVMTNNGWFGTEGAQEQHAAHSVLRAIEQGRPVVRVANNGISGVAYPDGEMEVLRDSQASPTGALARVLEVRMQKVDTTYAQTVAEWRVAWIAALAIGAGLLWRRQRKCRKIGED